MEGKTRRERLYRTEAIVLKRAHFGEADRLLTLYTPYLGKIRVLAKGVRKPTSRKSGHLEPFTHCRLLIAKGRNLDIVTQAEALHHFLPLREELVCTGYAYYAAELMDRFTEEGVENHPLFDLLLDMLGWIGEASNLNLAMRFFEVQLLTLVGYRPQVFHCAHCGGALEPTTNFFSYEEGGILCPSCGGDELKARPISLPALKVLRFLARHDFSTCQRLKVGNKLQRELEEILQGYIPYILERNLKSVDFLHTLRQEPEGEFAPISDFGA